MGTNIVRLFSLPSLKVEWKWKMGDVEVRSKCYLKVGYSH